METEKLAMEVSKQEVGKQELKKVSRAKAKTKTFKPNKASGQGVNIRVIDHPKKGQVGQITVSLLGKAETLIVGPKVIPIKNFGLTENVTALFEALTPFVKEKWEFGCKPVYGFAFGIMPKSTGGYKAAISQHQDDGLNVVVLNANKHFTVTQIDKVIADNKLSISGQRAGWRKITLSKDNLEAAIKAGKSLLS